MTKIELLAAELSARQFLKVCERLRTEDHAAKVERAAYHAKNPAFGNYGESLDSDIFDSPSKHVAAVKRASLDLTRELAQLRSRKT